MMPFSPLQLLIGLVALLSVFGTGYGVGHSHGVDSQKVADQQAIDKVTAQIAENKRIANAELTNALNGVIAIQTERDKFKTKLQQEHQENVQTTDRLHSAYESIRLRFAADPARSGASCDNALPTKGNAPGNDGTSVCQLSEEATRSLRQIALDADRLRDDYKLLYDYVRAK